MTDEKKEQPHKAEIIVEAETLDAAIKSAAGKLDCPERNVRYRVVQQPRRVLFGLWSQPARITAWKHDPLRHQVSEALKAAMDIDGHYLTELNGAEIQLTVYAPLGRGKPVVREKVISDLREYEPERLDEEAVAEQVRLADGKTRVIGRLSKSGEKDASFSIDVAKDGMRAELTLYAPGKGGRLVELEDVMKGVIREGVVHGLRRDLIEWAVSERRYNDPVMIAEGEPASAGKDGSLEFGFQRDKHIIDLKEDENGRVDHRSLNLIEMVKAGQVLVRRIAPELGMAGKNVFGKEIPPLPGKNVELPPGENIRVSGDELIAGIDGHALWSGGRVVVTPVYHVKGDVNYATGNIDFNGTVCIDGLIEDAFSVKAGGSIVVKKSIGRCNVESGGNITVLGGILGRQSANVRAKGDVVALFIENAEIHAEGGVIASELILHSNVVAGGEIVLNGARAALVGGAVSAGGDITVKSIGGEGTTRTHVRAGAEMRHVLRQAEIRKEIAGLDNSIEKIESAQKQVAAKFTEDASLAEITRQLDARRHQVFLHMKALREELRMLDNEIDRGAAHATINVYDSVMAGTKIEIGTISVILSTNVRYVSFKKTGTKINVTPYDVKSSDI